MTHTLKPYPAYKDSGVAWLGQVPQHWEVRRLKNAARVIMGQSPSSNDCSVERIGLPFLQGCAEFGVEYPQPKQFCKAPSKVSPAGAILMSVRAPVGRLNTADQEYGIGRGLCAIVPHPGLHHSRFIRFGVIVCLDGLAILSTGSTYDAVSVADVAGLRIPLPPLPEQTAIVRFLDYMDRRIRRSIRAQQKLIKLLKEYRQTLIHQAVTGKIDVRTGMPYPAYKDSGVPWLGKVPEQWELKPLKRLVRLNASVLPDTTPADYEFRYIDIGTVGTGFLTREPQRLRFGNAPSRARRVLHMGDTIISTVRTYLKAVYYVDRDTEALVCSTGFAVLTPGPSTQPKYVSYLVQSNTFTDRVTAESVGTAYPAIAEGRLGSFYVPVPPLPEQTAIVEYLDAQTAKLDTAIAAARREIELLREYRERLIADVVTGKVDVRGVVAQLPEEPPEEEAETEEEEPVAEELTTVDSQEEFNGEE